jgi:hypothetical protein
VLQLECLYVAFELLSQKIAAGEDVRHELPTDIRGLWPFLRNLCGERWQKEFKANYLRRSSTG